MSKISLSKEDSTAVNMFTADMDNAIRSLTVILKNAFHAFRNGECGSQIRDMTRRLFDEWLTRSLLPKVGETVDV